MTDALVMKVARAMYRVDPTRRADYGSLPGDDRVRYEAMAAAALTVILREDVPAPTVAGWVPGALTTK